MNYSSTEISSRSLWGRCTSRPDVRRHSDAHSRIFLKRQFRKTVPGGFYLTGSLNQNTSFSNPILDETFQINDIQKIKNHHVYL